MTFDFEAPFTRIALVLTGLALLRSIFDAVSRQRRETRAELAAAAPSRYKPSTNLDVLAAMLVDVLIVFTPPLIVAFAVPLLNSSSIVYEFVAGVLLTFSFQLLLWRVGLRTSWLGTDVAVTTFQTQGVTAQTGRWRMLKPSGAGKVLKPRRTYILSSKGVHAMPNPEEQLLARVFGEPAEPPPQPKKP